MAERGDEHWQGDGEEGGAERKALMEALFLGCTRRRHACCSERRVPPPRPAHLAAQRLPHALLDGRPEGVHPHGLHQPHQASLLAVVAGAVVPAGGRRLEGKNLNFFRKKNKNKTLGTRAAGEEEAAAWPGRALPASPSTRALLASLPGAHPAGAPQEAGLRSPGGTRHKHNRLLERSSGART